MRHFIKLKSKVKQIKDYEVINLLEERDEIKTGTQVIVNIQGKEILLEVVQVKDEKVYWMRKTKI